MMVLNTECFDCLEGRPLAQLRSDSWVWWKWEQKVREGFPGR